MPKAPPARPARPWACRSNSGDEELLVDLARRHPVESHPLAGEPTREPPQLADEGARGPAGLARQRQRHPRAGRLLDDPGPSRQDRRGPVRVRAPHEERRARDRFPDPCTDHLSAFFRHEPAAVVGGACAAARVDMDGNGNRKPPVQPLATAAQRHQGLQPPGARAQRRHLSARSAGDGLPPRQDPVGRLEVRAVVKARRQLEPVGAERPEACPVVEVQDLEPAHVLSACQPLRLAASAAPRAASPTTQNSSP